MGVLVGKEAPDFTANAVLGDGSIVNDFNLKEHIEGKHAVIFFYPLDFTFVCPSELIAFDHRINDGGIGQVGYPLVADLTHSICEDYDVTNGAVALRGSFLIDKDGIVQHQVVNNLGLGRNIDEMLRMIDALQFHEEHGEVCPAGWKGGDAGMKGTPDGVAKYLSEHAEDL